MRLYLLGCWVALCLPMVLLLRPACAAPMGLTGTVEAGTTLSDPGVVRFDLGTRRLSDPAPLEHTFTLRNAGTVAVTVDRLQSSCGCLTALLDGAQSPPLTVGPGGIVPLHVSIAPHRLVPGPLVKSVWVFTHGAEEAALRLDIVGTLQDDAAPTPPSAPAASVPSSAVTAPRLGTAAPLFARTDTQGRPFALSSVRGHPAALFFFCGCPWCAEAARAWTKTSRTTPARTLVVFAGTRAETDAFAARTGLDPAHTTLLPDPDSALTEGVYGLSSCPRAFALDTGGVVRYTNDHADDQPRVAPARTIIDRTRLALPVPR